MVWECLWFDLDPSILSPYVTPYSFFRITTVTSNTECISREALILLFELMRLKLAKNKKYIKKKIAIYRKVCHPKAGALVFIGAQNLNQAQQPVYVSEISSRGRSQRPSSP